MALLYRRKEVKPTRVWNQNLKFESSRVESNRVERTRTGRCVFFFEAARHLSACSCLFCTNNPAFLQPSKERAREQNMADRSTTTSAKKKGGKTKTVKDHLNQDQPIPGQNWVCLSFVSPEHILERRDKFYMKQFWHNITKAGVDLNKVDAIGELFDAFMEEHQASLDEKFSEQNNFQTTVRGLKVRGVYNTRDEADVRCRVLQQLDRAHNVYVAPVGYWCPWDPSPNQIADHEYLEPELNELMKSYKENNAKRDLYYEEQKRERRLQAMEENEQRKKAAEAEAAGAAAGAGAGAGDASDVEEKKEEAASTGGGASDILASMESDASHPSMQ